MCSKGVGNMMNTSERINFIADYLTNYESKIKLLNNCGLFDATLHFELFAQEVCKLWFGKQFLNLNIDTNTYPYIDLISEDKSIFVQVSTTESIVDKITKTLEKIQNSKKPELASIKNVKFFMLDNSSVSHVKDKTVGSLTFTMKSDLITTKMILGKAKTDFKFQTAFYELLQRDIKLMNDFSKMNEAIEKSKFDISEIEYRINGEYEINRSELVNKIRNDKSKNIAILGKAGCGKSAICKKLIENEANILYSRAERFIEERSLDGIWGFNIKNTLSVCKKIIFFIDSLEFIADNYVKNNLLTYLFEITKDIENAQIIVSCRTTDYKAFIKITNKYQIQTYEVGDISEGELFQIAEKYPIIQKLNKSSHYTELLKSPLYINLIVTKITDFTNIKDENDFREYIWDNIICLNDSETKSIVKQIVFNRAKDFLLYVDGDNFDRDRIEKLKSADILLSNGSFVRLKLDIFEDICFESFFDDEFNKCRGDYIKFFGEISTIGRCVYRRYQIWVSNKILSKKDRDKIIYSLIFSDTTPIEWKKETMIGLIRSRFSEDFFAENVDILIEKGFIDKFIYLTNLYGFEIRDERYVKYSNFIMLMPTGQGRKSLVEIIYNKGIYKTSKKIDKGILKLLSDYCKQYDYQNEKTKLCAINILEYYLEEDIKEIIKTCENDLYNKHDYTISILKPLYQLSIEAKKYIIDYWKQIEKWYKGDKKQYAKEIIEFTISFENSILAYTLPDEICALAKMFWTYQRPKELFQYDYVFSDDCWRHGLSEQASNYESKYYSNTPFECNFFYTLFYCNFWKGLKWAVEFINEAVLSFKTNCPSDCLEYEIQFVDEANARTYLGNSSMWFATIRGYRFPTVLGDLLFCLQGMIEQIVRNIRTKDVSDFAEKVKKYIYKNSNNIALLSMISDIGIKFPKDLPGYSLDLATNLDIVFFDSNRIMMPSYYTNDDLGTYVLNAQLYGNNSIKEKCYKILNYLYSVIPNDKNNAVRHLQIQKIDMRNAIIENNDKEIIITPSISGEAEKIVNQHNQILKPQEEVSAKLLEIQKNFQANDNESIVDDYIKAIDLILSQRDNFQLKSIFDKELAKYLEIVLLHKTLTQSKREKYCQIFIDGAKGYLENKINYHFDIHFCTLLFAQLQEDISEQQKNEIKTIILEALTCQDNNGLIKKIAREYLEENTELATAYFYTIIKLAEDEMNHQKFNANFYLENNPNANFEFKANTMPKLRGIDFEIMQAETKNEKVKIFSSQKDKIINAYLFKQQELNLEDFNIQDYDIVMVCHALSCGLSIDNNIIFEITKKIVSTMVDIWEIYYNSYEILNVYTLHEVYNFLGDQLTKNDTSSQKVFDILFNDMDFSKFTKETVKFYYNVFFALVPQYFDAYENNQRRGFLRKIFTNLEIKIQAIANTDIKDKLTRSLIFYFPQSNIGDWSKCKTQYSFSDKDFINKQLTKFGGKYFEDALLTIQQLHIEELLPEIIITLQYIFKEARTIDEVKFLKTITEQKLKIFIFISQAFIKFGDAIKQNKMQTEAFETLLDILCDYGFEEAAVILDEFRIH